MSTLYLKRLIEPTIKDTLNEFGAVWVRGPKWTGKTSTCERFSASKLNLRDPDILINARQTAGVQPSLLLRGKNPRLVDEWQLLPILWDGIISEVDKRSGKPGQFLLTGSATPVKKDELLHTGTGRIARVNMTTMTLEETGESSTEVSLSQIFKVCEGIEKISDLHTTPSLHAAADTTKGSSLEIEGESRLSVEDLATIICRGGWPEVIARGAKTGKAAAEYINALCETDLTEAMEEKIDAQRAKALIRSIARNVSQDVNLQTLLKDVQNSGLGMSEPTLRKYLNGLRSLYVLQDISAWAPKLRSKTPLRTSPVMHFCDTSIAAAALGANAHTLLADMQTFGYLFESLCIHDLQVYMQLLGGQVFRYRDKTGLEADAILQLPDARWAALEVKLGGEENINAAATNLLKLANRVDADASGSPEFLMILTGGKYAYTRQDGIHVCPLGCLCS